MQLACVLCLLFDKSGQSMGPPKISGKEVIDHYNMKYKGGEIHCMYFMGQKTKMWDDKRNYANRAFNSAS